MTCALKGFSTLIQEKGKTKNRQFDQMYHSYHGKKPHHPSQIRMLCKGHGSYRALYDVISQVTVTSKNGTTESVNRLFLKPSLHLDLNVNYRADFDIVTEDLERKTVNNPLLVTGRSLHVLAKKGISFYRALSFAVKKWDVKTNQPFNTGCNVDDVIDYVRREMYNEMYDIEREDSDIDDDYNELDEVGDATSDRVIY